MWDPTLAAKEMERVAARDVTTFHDQHGVASTDELGGDNVMCETDDPHSDSTWPDCTQTARAHVAGPAQEVAVQGASRQRPAVVPVHASRADGGRAVSVGAPLLDRDRTRELFVARAEMAVCIGALLDRWPNPRLDPGADGPRPIGMHERGVMAIPVLCDAP